MTSKEALLEIRSLNSLRWKPEVQELCSIISKELEELDRYRLLCYGNITGNCSTIILPNDIKVKVNTGCIYDFFTNRDVKKWLETGE